MKAMLAKSKNRRIEIFLLPEKVFLVKTKRLVDFKTRKILITENIYSVQTFTLLRDLFALFLNDSEVKNKILLKELSEIEKMAVITNLGR
jgi:hypothetical protein